MFLYEFDTFGIIYTAVTGVLIALLLAATIVFCVRRSDRGGATIAFRVLDIILLVLLVVCWAAYVLARVEIAGVDIAAVGAGDAALRHDGSELLTLPGCASLVAVAQSVLGTILLGAVSALCIASLVLSFVRRKRSRAADSAPVLPGETQPAPAAAEEALPNGTDAAGQPAETPVAAQPPAEDEQSAEERVYETAPAAETASDAEPSTEERAETPAAETTDEEIPAAETTDEETVFAEEAPTAESAADESAAPETAAESAEDEEKERTATEEKPAARPTEDSREEYGESGFAAYPERTVRKTSDKKYASALQMPGVKKKADTIAAADVLYDDDSARQSEPAPLAEETRHDAPRPLPITRKLVITNRMNVVNMYNEYLKEKRSRSESIAGGSHDRGDKK